MTDLVRLVLLVLVVQILLVASAAMADEPGIMRREPLLHFEVNEAFQADGGVQYFYELADADSSPETTSTTFPFFLAFDFHGRWASRAGALHVVMSRLVYTIEKDSSFFTEARANDVSFMNAVAPGLGVTRAAAGVFRVASTPANTFRIRWLGPAEIQKHQREAGLRRLLEFGPEGVLPESVVVQYNFDFDRMLGFRTGEMSVTWTAHYSPRPGTTRVCVFTMSYLHNLPPGFLGGKQRVFSASVGGAEMLIRNLRLFRP